MERRIDLHVHTTASDGTLTPARTVELASELGLAAIAVTDHDTAAGLAEAAAAGRDLGVEVVPGIELAADYQGREVHVLGYFIDPAAPALRQVMDAAIYERDARNERIVAMLERAGFPVSMDRLRAAFPGAVLGRPHIARLLVEQGYAATAREAIDRYMVPGAPYYSPRRRIPLADAVRAIGAGGGIASLAHPMQYGFDRPGREAFVRAGVDAGIGALEAYYSEHSPAQQAELLETAARYGLAVTGGSDFHGEGKPNIRMGTGIGGTLAVPYGVLERLRRAVAARQDGQL